MLLPIIAYGHQGLREETKEIALSLGSNRGKAGSSVPVSDAGCPAEGDAGHGAEIYSAS